MITDNHGYLRDFARSRSSKIVHIQCDMDAKSISEQCRNYLDREKGNRQILTYFAFNAHDTRFNSLLPMFASIFSHFFQNRTFSPEINKIITNLALPRWWHNDMLDLCWHQLKQERFVTDALLVLGKFDECCESEALWFLSEIRRTMETTEGDRGRIKVVLVTSKNTILGEKIAEALSELPGEVVTTISHARSTKSPSPGGIRMSKLLLKYPELAEPLTAADVTHLTKLCGQDADLSKLLYKLIQDIPVPGQTEERPSSFLRPTFEEIFEQALGQIPIMSRGWARRVLTFILTSLRPLRVHEFHTVSELCARLDDPAYKPQWLTRNSSSTNHEVVKLLRSLQGLLSIKDDEIHFSHRNLRLCLMSEESSHDLALPRPWYRIGSEVDRHLNVFEISLAHLHDLPTADSYYPLLPYAIEHWVSHYKVAAGLESDEQVRDLFNNQRALEVWLNTYTSISSSWAKPLPETRIPLCIAAHFGLENITKHFLDHTASSSYTEDWEKATLAAVRAGELSVFRLLFQNAPRSLEFEDRFLQNAVLEASNSGHVQVFREIVGHIPKARHPIPDWNSIRRSHTVETASDPGLERIASNALEESGSDDSPDVPFRWLATVLTNACDCRANDLINPLLQLGASPDSTDPTGFSALAAACWLGWARVVEMLLQHGADSEGCSGPNEATPLFSAASGGSAEVVELLLENRASVNTEDELLPLQLACWEGRFDAAETILRHMPMPMDLKSLAPNPFLEAISTGCYRITEAFLRRGVSPDYNDSSGSALGIAVFSARYDLCKLLLDYKADPNITHQSQPPLVVAVREGNLDVVTLLIKSGADVNKALESGDFVYPPLCLAAANGQVDITRILLENGANPNAAGGHDYTALLLAAGRGVIPTKTHHIKGSG